MPRLFERRRHRLTARRTRHPRHETFRQRQIGFAYFRAQESRGWVQEQVVRVDILAAFVERRLGDDARVHRLDIEVGPAIRQRILVEERGGDEGTSGEGFVLMVPGRDGAGLRACLV